MVRSPRFLSVVQCTHAYCFGCHLLTANAEKKERPKLQLQPRHAGSKADPASEASLAAEVSLVPYCPIRAVDWLVFDRVL